MAPNDQAPRYQLVDPSTGDVVGSVFGDGNGNVEIQDETGTSYLFPSNPSSGTDVARFQDLPSDTGTDIQRFDITALDDTESREIPLRVDDTETLEVYRWGAFDASDGTAPTGLDVELVDGSDTVQASANTVNNQSTSTPVASFTNSSGSTSVFKLRVNNTTGSAINSPGVGANFGWQIA